MGHVGIGVDLVSSQSASNLAVYMTYMLMHTAQLKSDAFASRTNFRIRMRMSSQHMCE